MTFGMESKYMYEIYAIKLTTLGMHSISYLFVVYFLFYIPYLSKYNLLSFNSKRL